MGGTKGSIRDWWSLPPEVGDTVGWGSDVAMETEAGVGDSVGVNVGVAAVPLGAPVEVGVGIF